MEKRLQNTGRKIMKKLLSLVVALGFCASQSPVIAATDWAGLITEVGTMTPVSVDNNITSGDSTTPLTSGVVTQVINMNGHTVDGGSQIYLQQSLLYNSNNLTINSGTFATNYSSAQDNDGGAINNTGILTINNVSFDNLTTNFDGGAIGNTGGSVTINSTTGTLGFTNNDAGGYGGAISSKNGSITINANGGDVSFSSNRDHGGLGGFQSNDIYLNNSTLTLNSVGAGDTITITDGISGNGTVDKSGAGVLALSGNYAGFTGNYTQNAGTLNLGSSLTVGATSNVSAGNVNLSGSGTTLTYGGAFAADASLDVGANTTFTLTGTSGSLIVNPGDVWSGEIKVLDNSTMTLDSISGKVTDATIKYNQNNANLILKNNAGLTLATADSKIDGTSTVDIQDTSSLTLKNGASNAAAVTMGAGSTGTLTLGQNTSSAASILVLNSGTSIVAGTVNVGAAGGTDTSNQLTASTGATIGSGAVVNLYQGNLLNIAGGSVTLNDSAHAGSTGDLWDGIINMTATGGSLTLDDFDKTTTATSTYNQSVGTLALQNGSDLILATSDSTISGTSAVTLSESSSLKLTNGLTTTAIITMAAGNTATLTVGQNASLASSNLALNSGSSIVAGTVNIGAAGGTDTGNTLTTYVGSTVGSGAAVNVFQGNTLTVAGGDVTLNQNNTSADTWAGTITNTSGKLTLSGVNQTTDATIKYTQNGTGELDIVKDQTGAGFTSNVKLATSDSHIDAGTVVIGGLSGTGTDDINNVLDISATGASKATLASAAAVTIAAGNTLSVTGGDATLNGTGAGTIDTWNGNVNISSGTLTLDALDKTTDANAKFTQVGGALNLTNDSDLILNTTDSSITTDGTATGVTTVNIGTSGSADTSSLVLTSGTLTTAIAGDALNINVGTSGSTGNTLQINGGTLASSATVKLNSANELLVTAGSATMDAATSDTIDGIINLSGTGALTINNLDKTTVATTGTFNQTGGTLNLTNDADLTLATGGSITGGTVTLDGTNTGNSVIVDDGGAFGITGDVADVALTLNASNNFNVTGGTAYLNNNDQSGWLGAVSMDSGSLTMTNIDHTATANASYTQTGGTLNLAEGSELAVASTAITAGTVNIASTGTASNLKLTYGSTTSMNPNVDINLNGGGTLTLDTNTYTLTNTSNTLITGGVAGLNNTLIKEGTGSYVVDRSDATADFGYKLAVNQGTVSVTADTANFVDLVTVGTGTVQAVIPTLTVAADDVNFLNGLTLSEARMNILNQGFDVTGDLTVGSTVDTMNGVTATNNVSGDLAVGSSGTADYLIDIDARNRTSDKYDIAGNITETVVGSTISIKDFQLVGDAPIDRTISFNIFDANGTVDPNIIFNQTDKTIATAIGNYGLFSQGNGAYNLSLTSYNPQVFRGQVATVSAYANQLTTNNMLFDHIGLISQQLLSEEKPNIYANQNPLFAPYQYSMKDGGLWYKAYGNIERLDLSQGINTQNNS